VVAGKERIPSGVTHARAAEEDLRSQHHTVLSVAGTHEAEVLP